MIRDAHGANVLLLPFTGVASRRRKMQAAEVILAAVNGPGRPTDPEAARGGERTGPERRA